MENSPKAIKNQKKNRSTRSNPNTNDVPSTSQASQSTEGTDTDTSNKQMIGLTRKNLQEDPRSHSMKEFDSAFARFIDLKTLTSTEQTEKTSAKTKKKSSKKYKALDYNDSGPSSKSSDTNNSTPAEIIEKEEHDTNHESHSSTESSSIEATNNHSVVGNGDQSSSNTAIRELDLALNSFTDLKDLSESWVKQGLAAKAVARAKRMTSKRYKNRLNPEPGPSTESIPGTSDTDVIEENSAAQTDTPHSNVETRAGIKRHLEAQDTSKTKKAKLSPNDFDMKMAIVPQNYPDSMLTENMIPELQKIVWDLLEEMPNPLPKLSIGNVTTGALSVSCEDSAGVEVLKKLECVELEGIKLKVVDAKDLPKPVKMAWKTRNVGCTDTTRVLRMLQRLNPLLRTNEWKVIDTVIEGTHTRRIVLVDRISADIIKKAGYSLPAGIDKCTFKVIESARKVTRPVD